MLTYNAEQTPSASTKNFRRLKIKFVLDQVKARQAMKAEPPKSAIGPSGPFLIS
jgi:hypothetical protein